MVRYIFIILLLSSLVCTGIILTCEAIDIPEYKPTGTISSFTEPSPSSASSDEPVYTSPIVFNYEGEFNSEIVDALFVMEGDGSTSPHRITLDHLGETFMEIELGDISPDGTMVAFAGRTEFGRWQIYTTHIDGTHLAKISQNDNQDYFGGYFSPGGGRISYYYDEGDGGIYINNLQGSDETIELNNQQDETVLRNVFVDWISDTSFLYIMHQEAPTTIFQYRERYLTSHSHTTKTSNVTFLGSNYVLSPSQVKVAFTGNELSDSYNFMLLNLGSAEALPRTSDANVDDRYIPVAWTTNSEKIIAYKTTTDPNVYHMYLVDANTFNPPVPLTSGGSGNLPLSFSPDNTKILFASNENQNPQQYTLYTFDLDSETKTSLWNKTGKFPKAIWRSY